MPPENTDGQSTKHGLSLGPTLDHLFNGKISLRPVKGDNKRDEFGIEFPQLSKNALDEFERRGTGNIVVVGRPGAGKSTFGLQVACAAAQAEYSSIYVSLEESLSDVKYKANQFDWAKYITTRNKPDDLSGVAPSMALDDLSGVAPSMALANSLYDALSMQNDEKSGQVLLTTLSQRPLSRSTDFDALFWDRYAQLERLLIASKSLLTDKDPKRSGLAPRVIVIDSLNMLITGSAESSELGFGGSAAREALFRVFEIVRRSGLVGVFLVEANDSVNFDSTIADAVIALRSEKVRGYFVRHIEVEKSRYSKHTLGEHPYKIADRKSKRGHYGIVAFPSVHAVIAATKKERRTPIGSFDMVSPVITELVRSNLRRGDSLAIVGPNGTFKSSLALNFLAGGLSPERSGKTGSGASENVLYIRLGNHFGEIKSVLEMMRLSELPHDFELQEDSSNRMREQITPKGVERKATVKLLCRSKDTANPNCGRLIVLDLETGALLPEEFVDIVVEIFSNVEKHCGIDGSIRRVVLDDVSLIGVSYPFLRHSKTTEDLFLSTFVHLMKNLGVDLVMVGTSGELPETQDAVNRASELADAVLNCRFQEIFGQREVVLTGDGVGTTPTEDGEEKNQPRAREFVPAVLRRVNGQGIKIDKELLQGLIGFETGKIQRPGVTVYVSAESEPQRRYAKEIENLLETIVPMGTQNSSVVPFGAMQSETIHHSFDVLRHEPRDRTILYTVDEFKHTSVGEVKPYSKNVLLLAYRSDLYEKKPLKFKSWADVARFAQGAQVEGDNPVSTCFWFDRNAAETLSCSLMDALCKAADKDTFDEALASLSRATGKATFKRELLSLHNLFHLSEESEEFRTVKTKTSESRDASRRLVTDSGMYLCWYSQLRELVDRCPALAPNLSIAALPGGGFTGDWYLTVLPSSVSINLGQKLVKTLTQPDEDFKRFARGVGLPTLQPTELKKGGFLAWPRSTVPLMRVLEIHNKAKSRSKIEKYELFRGALQTACDWMTPLSGGKLTETAIWENVARLPRQIALLKGHDSA